MQLMEYNDHFVGKVLSVQDSILVCFEPVSNTFIGEIVLLNNTSYKGIVFRINIKIFLFNFYPKLFFIVDSIVVSTFQFHFFSSNKKLEKCKLFNLSKRCFHSKFNQYIKKSKTSYKYCDLKCYNTNRNYTSSIINTNEVTANTTKTTNNIIISSIGINHYTIADPIKFNSFSEEEKKNFLFEFQKEIFIDLGKLYNYTVVKQNDFYIF